MPDETARKLRVLCFHGFQGSARVLEGQMATYAAAFASSVEFVFLDAPSIVAGGYGWWRAVDREKGGDGLPQRSYEGWEATRSAIVAVFASDGPFDGIFGFSQGAALAGLLVALRAAKSDPLAFDFAILVSGFSVLDRELARLYVQENPDTYALPSLHLIGRADTIVPPASSEALAAHFSNPTIVEHDRGHVLARDPQVLARVGAFLEARLGELRGGVAARE